MYLLPALGVLAVFMFVGMVLYRFVAVRLLHADRHFSDDELHCHSIVLGILTNAVIGQFLAIAQIFNLWSFGAVFLVAVFVLNREATQVLLYWISLPRRYLRLFLSGDFLLAGAWSLFMFLVVISLPRTQLSSLIPDVLAIHTNVSKSIINNSGFIYPFLIGSKFYGMMPAFVDLMFAQVWMLHDDRMVIRMLHFTLYVGFFISLFAYARRTKWLAVLVLCSMLPASQLYYLSLQGMNDTARAVFATLSIVFLVMYSKDKNWFYPVFSGLLLGAAIGSKYLGLGTAFVCGLVWLYILAINRRSLRKTVIHLGAFSALVILVGGFWYIKNWIFIGNPIYPFLFGHPGIPDAIIIDNADRLKEHYSPAFRHFTRDFFSFGSWLDLARATHKAFVLERAPINTIAVLLSALGGILFLNICDRIRPAWKVPSIAATLVLFAGLIALTAFKVITPTYVILFFLIASALVIREKTNLITIAAFVWCAVWYFFVWRTNRFGITAHLLLLTAVYFATLSVSRKFLDSPFITTTLDAVQTWGGRYGAKTASFAGAAIVAGTMTVGLEIPFQTERIYKANKDFVVASFKKNGRDAVLTKKYYFWGFYSYVVRNGLINVMNPWETSSYMYMNSIVSEKAPRNALMLWNKMPANIKDLDGFLKRNKVKYFVAVNYLVKEKPPIPKSIEHYRLNNPRCNSLPPAESKKCGIAHVHLARKMYFALKTRSKIAYQDGRYTLLRINQ